MAVKNEFIYYLNKSDEDILNVFAQLHHLRTEVSTQFVTDTKSSSSNFCSTLLSSNSDSTDSAISVSPNSKLCHNNKATKSFKRATDDRNFKILKYDSIITKAFENLKIISKMFDTLEEHKEFWQTKGHSSKQKAVKEADCIISVDRLNERLQKINVVINHLREVSEKFRKLKQVLRCCDQTDSLKSHVQYHRSILNFFAVAHKVLKDLSKDLVVLENSNSSNLRDSAYSEFSRKVSMLTTEIHKSIDRLKEFESYVRSPDLNMFS